MEKREIRQRMMDVEYARRELMRPYFIGLGLTIGQGQPRILNTLLQHGGMTQRALAEACNLDAATLSRTLDRMEEAGLLVRSPHASSRRAYVVELTARGGEVAGQVHRGFAALDDVLCRGFTPGELEVLCAALEHMGRNLAQTERIDPEGETR